VAVGVGADDDHVGDCLPPGQLVGMVLIRPDEHHGPLPWRDLAEEPVASGEALGQAQFQDADQLADRRGGTGAAEDHQMISGAADGVVDDLAGVLPKPAGGKARARALGVGVGVPGQHLLADNVLDEVQRPARRRVVGVGDAPRPVRALEYLPVADDSCPDPVHQGRSGLHPGRVSRGWHHGRALRHVPGLRSAHIRSIATDGGEVRLLCTVQCATTARSAGHLSAGRQAGTSTVSRMPLTRAGRSVAMS
jgi:hypothetical protein